MPSKKRKKKREENQGRGRNPIEEPEALNRARAILDSALDCIITMDHQGNVVEFNPAAEETFGYRRDEVIGRQLCELIIPASLRELHRKGLSRGSRIGPAERLYPQNRRARGHRRA